MAGRFELVSKFSLSWCYQGHLLYLSFELFFATSFVTTKQLKKRFLCDKEPCVLSKLDGLIEKGPLKEYVLFLPILYGIIAVRSAEIRDTYVRCNSSRAVLLIPQFGIQPGFDESCIFCVNYCSRITPKYNTRIAIGYQILYPPLLNGSAMLVHML